MKSKPEDRWFSLFIRQRDGWKCRRCGRQYQPYVEGGDNKHLFGLHNAHCFTRGAMTTRFDEENCMALCYGCHKHLDQHPDLKYEFWESQIGEKQFALLRVQTHNATKFTKEDKKEIGEYFKRKFFEGN